MNESCSNFLTLVNISVIPTAVARPKASLRTETFTHKHNLSELIWTASNGAISAATASQKVSEVQGNTHTHVSEVKLISSNLLARNRKLLSHFFQLFNQYTLLSQHLEYFKGVTKLEKQLKKAALLAHKGEKKNRYLLRHKKWEGCLDHRRKVRFG